MTATQRQAYTEFCQQVPAVPVFAQPWFLDAVAEGGEWSVALVEDNGQVVAALPYFLKRQLGFRYVTMPLFTKYLGPLLRPGYDNLTEQHRLLGLLQEQLPAVHAYEQQWLPALTNWLPFHWAGYQQTTQYTYRLDLREHPHWEQQLNRNMRRNLAKADAQLQLRTDLGLEEFYRLNTLSFARQGLQPPYTLAQLRTHNAALAAHDARQLFFACDEQGRIHSAAYLIWDRQAAYYHLSGDDPALRQSGSGIWLVARAIRYTQDTLGLPVFDFEGSMLASVEAIRRQFGAVQTPYFRVWRYESPLFRSLQWLRRALQ